MWIMQILDWAARMSFEVVWFIHRFWIGQPFCLLKLSGSSMDSGLGSHSVFCSCLVHQFPLVSPFTAIGEWLSVFCDISGQAMRTPIRGTTLQHLGKNMFMEIITTIDIHSCFKKKEVWSNLQCLWGLERHGWSTATARDHWCRVWRPCPLIIPKLPLCY